MRGPDNRAQVMRIFHAVQNHVQPAAGDGFFERGESLRRSEPYYSLMSRSHGRAIQHFARFETHGDPMLARQIDDFLNARSSGPLGDQDTIKRTPGS
jgi:hypothetical protein